MIHRDLCDPARTKLYSKLRMKFHFVLSRFTCFDGYIPLTIKEIATECNCDVQSIYKYIKLGIRDGILRLEGDRIYLLKYVPSNEYKKGYVKHFPFLESEEFMALNVHTQRFICYALWYGVHSGRPLSRPISSLYHTQGECNGVLNLYSKAPALMVLEESKAFLTMETFTYKGEEWFKITGIRKEFDVAALHNKGEEKWLEDRLMESYCHDILSCETKINLMRMKDEYTTKLGSIGMELFTLALDKLLLTFSLFEKETNGEVCQFLRGILADLEERLLPTIEKRIEYTKEALSLVKDMLVKEAPSWVRRFTNQLSSLMLTHRYLINKIEERKQQREEKQKNVEPFPFFNWLEDRTSPAIR